MSRRLARENIFKLVFEYLFCGEENEISLKSAIEGTDESEKGYVDSLYRSVISNSKNIIELIKRYSRDFAYDRIYKIDLAILHVAVSEILYCGIPYQISVNEALEIAKKYSTEKSPAFINGVLAGIISDGGVNESEALGREKDCGGDKG